MRVLVVSATEPWHRSHGDAWTLYNHLLHWAQTHELSVVTAGGPPGRHVVTGRLPVPAVTCGVRLPPAASYIVRRVQSEVSREPMTVPWVASPALRAEVATQLADRVPDVVHLFGWGTAQLWRRLDGVPAVHFANDPWTLNYRNRRLPGWRRATDVGQHAKVRAHERRHYPHLGAVVVVSERDAADLRRLVPAARVEVVGTGVDPGPAAGPLPAGPVLGFHGNFQADANVEAALALGRVVLPQVRQELPAARLLLVGRDPPEPVRGLAGAHVEVTGAVDDVRAQLDRVTVYVAPMTSGTGMKHKVLEALAAGRPVVATPQATGGIGAGDGVVEVADVAAVAPAVLRLLRDPAQLAAAGAAGRRLVTTRFSWADSAERVAAIWRDVVG